MPIRFAFAGFRHGHIQDLYKRATDHKETGVVAACEEDAAAREEVSAKGVVKITHSDFERMLKEVPCDVVAVGDTFGRRGELAIRALSAGKHVIVDKPLCTRLSELDEIERLAREKNLKVGCMLTMRDSACVIGARDLIRRGEIGEVHAVAFGGQHPLLLGSRPGWYWEPGKHGGTINDIGIHAADALPWITGLRFATVNAARCWNAFAPERPHFQDGAQMMLTMNNGCGVLGDVSYFMPDGAGYSLPFYWRMTFFGREGILEIATTVKEVRLVRKEDRELRSLPLPAGNPGGYLTAFLNDIRGAVREGALHTDEVIRSSRVALAIQKAADENAHDVQIREA